MTNSNDAVKAKLKDLRDAFLAQLPGKVRQIEDAWTGLLQSGWDSGKAGDLARLLHTLAGTAGTFGLAAARTAAQGCEAEIRAMLKEGKLPRDGAAPDIGGFLSALRNACAEDGNPPAARQQPSSPSGITQAPPANDTVFFVEDDPLLAESLALQIRYYGYQVAVFNTLAGLRNALKTSTPLLVIMDMSFPEGGLAGADTIAQIQQGRDARIPVVFVSGRSDFDARLEAVRSGGDAYFTKPVDVGKLVDRLDVLTHRRPRDPYRILVVDDEPLLADYHATILQGAGMTTASVNDPVLVLRRMADFRPELILMDVYMPGCSGMELAGVIRQDETFIDIPIVFLSAERDVSRQLLAMSRGGDDFLTKPIQPEHLVASVTLRADRHRVLRSFMLYDGLTGLLNHTRTKELVEVEVSRASRMKTRLTFAMIDIDHFKSINDTHGHPVGDQVIKSLSRLLKQRLRATDSVGRFGGEEFAIIFPDTDGLAAQRILNELREDFAKIRHQGPGDAFSVTFSSGAASYTPGCAGAGLIGAADAALYDAKRSGRNRVVLAQAGDDDARS